MVKPKRLKSIGAYIDEGGKFPTNIVINFKIPSALRFDHQQSFADTATGILHLPAIYGSAWVIDGQHRLYGYAHAERSKENDNSVITVLAYQNLPINEEIKLFVDINTEQVKVSRNIVNELLSNLDINDPDPRKNLEAMHARVALMLDVYSGSPLRDRVVTVSHDKTSFRCITQISLADQIRLENLVGSIYQQTKSSQPIEMPGPLSDPSGDHAATMDKAVKTLSLYLSMFATKLKSHWQLADAKGGYLCTNNGIRALIVLFRKLSQFVENKDDVKFITIESEDIVDRVATYLEPAIEFFRTADASQIEAFRTGAGSSLSGVTQNSLKMMSIINETMPEFTTPELQKYLSSRDIDGTKQARIMIDEIEKIICDDIISNLKNKFGVQNDVWWIQGIPRGVKNSCDQMFNDSVGDKERWQYFTFINYLEILLYSQNWEMFKDYYNFHGKGKKADLVGWLGHLSRARNITHHPPKGPLSKDEVDFVRRIYQVSLMRSMKILGVAINVGLTHNTVSIFGSTFSGKIARLFR